MKRLIAVCLVVLLVCVGVPSVSAAQSSSSVTLNVYNWGEYIDPTVNDLFTEETGIKVNYKNFTDNESMYAVLDSGARLMSW